MDEEDAWLYGDDAPSGAAVSDLRTAADVGNVPREDAPACDVVRKRDCIICLHNFFPANSS